MSSLFIRRRPGLTSSTVNCSIVSVECKTETPNGTTMAHVPSESLCKLDDYSYEPGQPETEELQGDTEAAT